MNTPKGFKHGDGIFQVIVDVLFAYQIPVLMIIRSLILFAAQIHLWRAY